MFWIAIFFSVSVWMNLPLRAAYVVRLHSQNNDMKSNNHSIVIIVNKINQFSSVAFNLL